MRDPERMRRGLGLLMGAAVLAAGLGLASWGKAGALERGFCASVAVGLVLLVGAATGRVGFSMLASGALLALLAVATGLKMQYLQTPVLAPDLRQLGDPAALGAVLKFPRIGGAAVVAVLGGAALIGLCWRWSPTHWSRVPGRARRVLARAGATLLVALALAIVLGPPGPFGGLFATDAWGFIASAQKSPLTGFFVSFTRTGVSAPEFARGRAQSLDWRSPDPPSAAQLRPDIVAVLEESTFPPRLLAACDRPECDLPMFAADERTAASGGLQVHTWGSCTWTTEFAFLTGLPHALFGPAGVYAPYNLAPRVKVSLPRLLHACGNRSVAVYPVSRTFVDAGRAYAHYGFDAFYDASDLGLKWESTDLDVEQAFERTWRRERAASEAPLFFFVLTLRQHGPHDAPLSSLAPPFDQPLFPALDAQLNLNLGNFLARMRQSDQALAALDRVLKDEPRPTVLVYFGDHQPAFDGRELKMVKRVPPQWEAISDALTYFVVKTHPAPAAHQQYPLLDVAYLAGVVLESAGVTPDDYFAANIRLRERCDGRFLECKEPGVLESFYAEIFDHQGVFER